MTIGDLMPEVHSISESDLTAAGFRLVRVLRDQQSYECVDRTSRRVVLKRLADDCLFKGRLHPSIAERLQRIQQLPHRQVATLLGVEKIKSAAFLIWDFVRGQTLNEQTELAEPAVRKELTLLIDSLHAMGIVHGNIKPSNIIRNQTGDFVLTHASPLLYQDPQADWQGFDGLFDDAEEVEAEQEEQQDEEKKEDRRLRSKTRIAAAIALLVGIATAVYFWHAANNSTQTATEAIESGNAGR